MSNAYKIKVHMPPPDHVAIERMAAADLVILARRAGTAAQGMTLDEREQYAQRFEALIAELGIAVLLMRQGAPADRDHIPPTLRPGTTDVSPSERRALRLLTDAEARIHE